MNEDKILIIDKTKKNKDITTKVYKYNVSNNYYYLYFDSNKTKLYKYRYNRLQIIENPRLINGNVLVRVNHCALSNVDKILQFRNHIKVFFKNNTTKLYNESEISIEQNLLSEEQNRNIFLYLKEMASHLKMSDITKLEFNNYKEDDFLEKVYNKISFVSEKSILRFFLSARNDCNEFSSLNKFLYPFSFNLSQQEAVYNAFNNRISVIEGPPGTGKTQTILNIIVNAILQNKTIAVLSNNNSATNNVYEKLEKEGLSHLAAKLGNKDNINNFFKEQTSDFSYPTNWNLTVDEEINIINKINKMNDDIKLYLKQRNEIAEIEQELNGLKLEKNYFINHVKNNKQILFKKNNINNFSSIKLHSYLAYLNKQENKTEYFSKKVQILSQIKFRFINFKLYKNDIEKVLESIEYSYYNNRIMELENNLKTKRNIILSLNLEKTFKEYTEMSMQIFKSYICKKFNDTQFFDRKQLKQTEILTKCYPIILSTTYSLLNCTSNTFLFDYVIIDESSQADLVSSFPALTIAKNVIVVGDSKQLPNIIDGNKRKIFENIFNKYNINDRYDYTKNNLLNLTKNLYNGIPCKVLREHYRCHPKIIEFCNKKFYDNQLIILSQNEGIEPIKQFKCVKGNHARRTSDNSWFNDRESEIIKNEIIPNESIDIESDSIGIITPYKAQKIYLKNKLGWSNVTIDTVHGFQGREKKIIIFSTVANDITKFLDNPNSINVAVSRAINNLYLITPYEYKSSNNSNISNLISYISYNNFEIIDSKISSIFDLLYKVNEEQRKNFFKTHLPIAKYSSEGLMFHQIREVLSMKQYFTYDVRRAYPLRLIVNDRTILTTEENSFIKTNSHLDFVIYNKFDKKPMLAIEVDGYSFHSKQEQIIRDNKKDSILSKCNIPFLRFKTNECNEKQKIISKLEDIIKNSAGQ